MIKRAPFETIHCLLYAFVLFGVTQDSRAALGLVAASLVIPHLVSLAPSDTSRVRVALALAWAGLMALGFRGMLHGHWPLYIAGGVYLTLLIFHAAHERSREFRTSATLILSIIPLYYSADGGARPFITVPAGTILVILSWLLPHLDLRSIRRMAFATGLLMLVGLISLSVVFSKGAAHVTMESIWYAQENWGWGADERKIRRRRRRSGAEDRTLNLLPPRQSGEKVVHAFVRLESRLPTRSRAVYLREAAYDTFNGRMWLSRGGDYRTRVDGEGDDKPDGWITIGRPQTEAMCRYRVYLPKIRSRQLLMMPGSVSVGVPSLLEGQNATFRLPQSGFESVSYPVVSAPAFFNDILSRAPKVGDTPKMFRELPATDLVRRIRDETHAEVSAFRDPIQRISQIVGRLRTRCKYTKTPRNVPGKNLENFLYGDRQGHCSLFATACALQLRAAKIPSRVVVGYLSATMDPNSEVYVFTNKDRHAWVEVYMRDFGWVTLDPTPPGAAAGSQLVATDFKEQEKNFLELGNAKAAQVLRQGPGFISRLRDETRAHGQSLLALLGALAAFLVYVLHANRSGRAAELARRRRRRVWEGPEFFLALCRHYAACGCPRAKGQTAREYLARLRKQGLASGELGEMIDYYYAIRYEGVERSAERENEFLNQLQSLPKPEPR